MERRFSTPGVLTTKKNILPYFIDETENINELITCKVKLIAFKNNFKILFVN